MTRIDFHSNTRKTIYLTATPARSSTEENIIYQEYFRNVPNIELFDPNIDPHVNYVGMLFYSNPTSADIKRYSVGQFQFDRNIYMSYLVHQESFLKLTSIIVNMTLPINGKILIYIGINEAIEYIRQYIISEFPFLQNSIGIYTSIVHDKALRAEMLMKKYILTTTKSCGAAQDIPDLAACVMLAEPFRSKVLARQTLGRCRADNTLYIDCVDKSCYRTNIYYQGKKPVFNQYAKSCTEIVMDNITLDQKYNEVKRYWANRKLLTVPVFNR